MAAVVGALCMLYLALTAVMLVEGRPDFQSKGGKGKDRCSICKDFVESFEKVPTSAFEFLSIGEL